MVTRRSINQNGSSIPFAGRLGGNQNFALPIKDSQSSIQPFAGRNGGNQDFTLDQPQLSESSADLRKKTPDAAPLQTWRDILDLNGFFQPIIWKSALIECWGTSMLVFTVGLIANALSPYARPGSLTVPLLASITNWIAITLFVFAAAPASGGHLNPLITLSTFTAGLSTLPRSILYIVGQCIGAIIGALILKLGLSSEDYYTSGIVAGCTINTSLISYGQAYVLEAGTALAAIFLSFGVGLDPRQGQVLGAAFSPVLVGLTVALSTFGTGFVKEGWYGASLNPARCFGLMAAKENMHAHWIHWLAAITASIVNGVFYHFIPPYHKESIRHT